MNAISITILIVAMAIWMIFATIIMNDHTHEIKALKEKIKTLQQMQIISLLKDISEEDDNNDNNDEEKKMII